MHFDDEEKEGESLKWKISCLSTHRVIRFYLIIDLSIPSTMMSHIYLVHANLFIYHLTIYTGSRLWSTHVDGGGGGRRPFSVWRLNSSSPSSSLTHGAYMDGWIAGGESTSFHPHPAENDLAPLHHLMERHLHFVRRANSSHRKAINVTNKRKKVRGKSKSPDIKKEEETFSPSMLPVPRVVLPYFTFARARRSKGDFYCWHFSTTFPMTSTFPFLFPAASSLQFPYLAYIISMPGVEIQFGWRLSHDRVLTHGQKVVQVNHDP